MKKQINKSQVMKKAWVDFRTYGGNTMSFFSKCLKDAWEEAKMRVQMGAQGTSYRIQAIKEEILSINSINSMGSSFSGNGMAVVREIKNASIGFASDVASTVLKFKRASEKQAYVIARAAYNLGL